MESQRNQSSISEMGFNEVGILHKVKDFYNLERTVVAVGDDYGKL